MKALTAAEMQEVDRLTTERFGIPSLQLMEAAGANVANAVREATSEIAARRGLNVCVLCGKGNNGGDGFVAARHLKDGATGVRVYLFGKTAELKGDAGTNCRRWQEIGGSITEILDEGGWKAALAEVVKCDVIVDAMLGTGLRGPAKGPMALCITDINRISDNARAPRPASIVAVDIPSGMPSDREAPEGPVLSVHKTVTFTAPKIGQLVSPASAAVGSFEVANIGSPATLVEEVGKGSIRWIEPEEFAQFPWIRPADSHKGTFGHLLVVAGSLGKSGAAVMAGHAGLRGGAGLVTVATPNDALPIVASVHAEYMTEALELTDPGTASRDVESGCFWRFSKIEAGKTVLAIGPGLGQHPETRDFIRTVVRETELPIVLDADGLNAFAGDGRSLSERKSGFLAITPHPGEMARLLGASTKDVEADRVKTATSAARDWNAHVVLKGFHTVIASPDGQIFVNTSGNAGLAKGGSGDVLTGLLGALTAQFKTEDWVRVLALGVFLHGLAAELATAGTDESGLLAGEVANNVAGARHKIVLELQRRG